MCRMIPAGLRITAAHTRNTIPANTRRWPSVGLMLDQRRRRWANINPALGQRPVFAGILLLTLTVPMVRLISKLKHCYWEGN